MLTFASLRRVSLVIAVTLSLGSFACSADQAEAAVESDEQALTPEVAVDGWCGGTPVKFRVQVYKTLVRVWVPETSPGVEFEPLGAPFSGRVEYKQAATPPYQLVPSYYRYWKLPHATAGEPPIELRAENGPYASDVSYERYHDTRMVLTRDPSTGNEALFVEMIAFDRYHDEWGGATDKRYPRVTCMGQIDALPPPL